MHFTNIMGKRLTIEVCIPYNVEYQLVYKSFYYDKNCHFSLSTKIRC